MLNRMLKTGDTVKVACSGSPHVGKIGTVKEITKTQQSAWIRWRNGSKDSPVRIASLTRCACTEVEPEPPFQPGDKVRVSRPRSKFIGKRGVVKFLTPTQKSARVVWTDGSDDLVLVSTLAAESWNDRSGTPRKRTGAPGTANANSHAKELRKEVKTISSVLRDTCELMLQEKSFGAEEQKSTAKCV